MADSTKAQYRKAITNALAAGVNLADADDLTTYAHGLKTSGRSFLKAAIRLWSKRVEMQAKGNATPENVLAVLATAYRIEALNDAIGGEADKGQKAHTWLTQAEVKKLMKTCNTNTVNGKRDKIILGLLVGAGLRRMELVNLTFDDIVLQPIAGKFRTVLNLTGKGEKNRVVPINDALAAALDDWGNHVNHAGRIARSVTKGGMVKEGISAIGIFKVVAKAGEAIGKTLAPHDLRRTFAQLGYEAGVPITQIKELLGHASVATTQKYLNLDLDLEVTASDFIPFE